MKEKIKEYFSIEGLEVLDGGNKDAYSGVTVKYVAEYVTKGSISETAKTLLEMHDNLEIKALYCNDVNDIVFESMTATNHWNYKKENANWRTSLLFKCFIDIFTIICIS